jgi:excisionase family DNA binding protein
MPHRNPKEGTTMSATNQLATIGEAAEYVRCNPKTVRRWIAAGYLTGFRVGPRAVRVRLAEVEQLVRRIPTAADH